MVQDLDIEPDEPLDSAPARGASVATPMLVTAPFLPADFPLATLLQFMPDVKLKQRVMKAAEAALAVDIAAPGGLAKADAAVADLKDAIKDAKAPFEYPTGLANQLHKRLTGLRADFTSHGDQVVEDVSKAIVAETRRLERLAEEQRKRDQEAADKEARRQAEQLARDAARRKAPPETVAALKEEAKTATAPPVAARSFGASLSKSTTTEKWRGRFIGTEEDAEPNPEMNDLSPAQQTSARTFFAAIGNGSLPLTLGSVNWAEINRKAHAERSTFLVAGMEAVDVGGLRRKR